MACTLDKDHTYSQPVKIQSLVDPATYWLIPDQEEPPGKKIDQLLTERIRNTTANQFTPNEEQMVAVMDPTTTIWHRGKVKTIFLAEHDHRYLVFLVDYGTNLKVAQNLVRQLPTDEIFQKQQHATQFKLYGIVPCKKQVACQTDFKLVSVWGKEWDPIAYKFVANKAEVATAIYISTLKDVELCAGDVIQGDLHFVIGGRCISMIDDLCGNQYAIYNELFFQNRSGILKQESESPAAYHEKELENLPVASHDNLNGKPPSTSYGRGSLNITNPSLKMPTKSSWVLPTKEPVFLPGGMNINSSSQKSRRRSEPHTTRNKNTFPHGTNNSNSNSRYSLPPNSTIVETVKDVTEDAPTQGVSRLSDCTSPGSNETESSLKTIPVVNVSPKTTNDVVPEQSHIVVNPVSPDLTQQCVTTRGRRLQALLKDLEKTKEKDNANKSVEEVSFDSSLYSLNVSDNGSNTSGLFDKNNTESDNSNCGLTPVNSSCSLSNESPSSASSVKVQSKFLRGLDTDKPALYRHRQDVGKLSDRLQAARVLAHGHDTNGTKYIAQEIQTVEDAQFHPLVLAGLKQANVTSLTRIQGIVWPALARGEDLIMIHPPRLGKTLACIAPLVSSLLYKERYSKLPAGKGPLAVILCPSARSCEDVGEQISRLIRANNNIRYLLAFAGQDQKEYLIKLTNGCDILVATPRCLLRLLALSAVTDLTRVCHLVLDEAEILIDKFSDEIRNILDRCNRSKQHREKKGLPNDLQVVAASQKWCPILKDMLQQLAPTPLICIGTYLEAAIYARLQPILKPYDNTIEKRSHLKEILDENQHFCKIIIVCQTADEVEELIAFLKPQYHSILKADERMANSELLDVLPGWKALGIYGMYPILVCSDAILPELNIEDSTCLIHYSLPGTKSLFGVRFSCLMKNYPNLYDKKVDCTSCKVFIFVGGKIHSKLPAVRTFMKRLGATIDPRLESTANAELMEKERRKETLPLCKTLVAFGECWNRDECSLRHAILERDKPVNIPELGRVKLKFLSAFTASHFTARLLEHTDSHGVIHSSRNNYLKVMTRMKSHFACEEHRALHGYPKLGDKCAYETSGVFYRVEVTNIKSYDTAGKPENVDVHFIDIGKRSQCHIGKLMGLPKVIQEIPPLAVNVIMCRLLPRDLDHSWSNASLHLVTKWLVDQEEYEEDGPFIIGEIKLSLGNTLWLDPIQGRRCADDKKSKAGLICMDFREEMLKENLAIDNPCHLTNLYDICKESGISIPDHLSIAAKKRDQIKASIQLPDPQWAYIPDEDVTEVFFTSASNPGEFFVCLCKFVSNMKRLSNEIQKFVANHKPIEENFIIQTGVLCLGRFPDDGMWYRARVLNVANDGQLKLFFVDHGDTAFVDAARDIIPIQPKHITSLPFQAIECSLAGIEPTDGESWTEEATDELYELTVNLKTDYRKPMYLNLCKKEKAKCTGGRKYNILLACKDDDEKYAIVVNEVFIKNGLARLREDESKWMESVSLDELKKNVVEGDDLPEENDSGMWDDDCESDSAPVKLPDDSSGSTCAAQSEDDGNTTSNSGAVVALPKKNGWLPEEVHTGFGDFDFVFGDDDDIHPAEVFIRNFLKMEPKEVASPTSNQRPPVAEHMPEVPQSTVDKPNPCLPALCQNVASTSSAQVVQESGSGSKSPTVMWHQDQLTITMAVEIPNIEDTSYDLRVDKTTVAFTTVVDDETYSFNLQLYGVVSSHLCQHASTGRTIRIKLRKIVPGIWPRLQRVKSNIWWLRYNIDHADNEVEDLVRVNPSGQRQGVHKKRDICLDLQVEESEDSDMDDDERDYERRDPFNPLL